MWPKLMDLAEYRRQAYTGSKRPTLRTLRRRITLGTLPGECHGNRYYVLVGPNNEPMPRPSTDPIAEALLQSWLEETPDAAPQSEYLRQR